MQGMSQEKHISSQLYKNNNEQLLQLKYIENHLNVARGCEQWILISYFAKSILPIKYVFHIKSLHKFIKGVIRPTYSLYLMPCCLKSCLKVNWPLVGIGRLNNLLAIFFLLFFRRRQSVCPRAYPYIHL